MSDRCFSSRCPSPLNHGCCWGAFYIFAYCGLVVEIQIHLTSKQQNVCSPNPTSTSRGSSPLPTRWFALGFPPFVQRRELRSILRLGQLLCQALAVLQHSLLAIKATTRGISVPCLRGDFLKPVLGLELEFGGGMDNYFGIFWVLNLSLGHIYIYIYIPQIAESYRDSNF